MSTITLIGETQCSGKTGCGSLPQPALSLVSRPDVAGLLAPQAQLVNEYRYQPFGQSEVGFPAEQVVKPLRFQAREIDGLTELYYFRNRWYDPALARFLSPDPLGLGGGINPYVFAGNDPVNRTDPFGLDGDCTAQGKEEALEEFTERCPIELPGVSGTGKKSGGGNTPKDPCARGGCAPRGPGGGATAGRPTGGGGRGCPTCKKAVETAKQFNQCMAATSNQNFDVTNQVLFRTIPGNVARFAVGLGAMIPYNRLAGHSGVFADALAHKGSNPRMWLSVYRNQIYAGRAGIAATGAAWLEGTVAVGGALEAGIAIGSVGGALATCIGGTQ